MTRKIKFKNNELCKRYVKAIFELALDRGELDKINTDMERLKSLVEKNQKVITAIASPLASKEVQDILLKEIRSTLNLSNTTYEFILVLINNKRILLLESICSVFSDVYSEHIGQITGKITSACTLSKEQEEDIKSRIEKSTGKKFRLFFEVDKSILGGLILQIGSKMIDSSLRNKINELQSILTDSFASINIEVR